MAALVQSAAQLGPRGIFGNPKPISNALRLQQQKQVASFKEQLSHMGSQVSTSVSATANAIAKRAERKRAERNQQVAEFKALWARTQAAKKGGVARKNKTKRKSRK